VKAQKRIFSSFSSFFQKKQIGLTFYLTFRLENHNYLKCLPLIDDIAVGGLGLTTKMWVLSTELWGLL
jgi:hypothetical protein